ncbi:cysteine hydrolase [Fusibacter paucivorans]|uniref:Cysteine hydrolase n=1 Tax=Fusibacter paucivorans TaxID=76009 RepID=A0ABS5PQF3_9FIRM|nr:cysteine hydrolase [Fusibacter paucivorans]MBS7527394.1 cysteine hydrolase [Fusibacter paucivorans]
MDALVVVDMQKGIFNKKHIRVYDDEVLISRINHMIDKCHLLGIPVIFLRYTGSYVLTPGTENWDIINELHFEENDVLIDKYCSDAFEAEAFVQALNELGIRHVYISGVFSHGCVQATVMGAVHKRYDVSLIEDAHSNLAPQANRIIDSVNSRMKKLGVSLLTTSDFIEYVKNT